MANIKTYSYAEEASGEPLAQGRPVIALSGDDA